MAKKKPAPAKDGVTRVPNDEARPLVSVHEGLSPSSTAVKDAIVRYYPSEGVSPEEVASKVAAFKAHGAHAVKVVPARKSAVVFLDAKREPGNRRQARKVCVELAQQVRGVPSDELFSAIDESLKEAGL